MDKLIHKNMIKSSYKDNIKIEDDKIPQPSTYALEIGQEF